MTHSWSAQSITAEKAGHQGLEATGHISSTAERQCLENTALHLQTLAGLRDSPPPPGSPGTENGCRNGERIRTAALPYSACCVASSRPHLHLCRPGPLFCPFPLLCAFRASWCPGRTRARWSGDAGVWFGPTVVPLKTQPLAANHQLRWTQVRDRC